MAALHRLFARKRHHRDVIAVVGFASGTAYLGGASQTQPFRDAVARGNAGLLVGGGLLYYRQYTPVGEQQALAAWQAHQLPARLQRQLKASYFKEK